MLFRIIPTALEISLVCGILVSVTCACIEYTERDAGIDLQVQLGFCGYHISNFGRIYMVYCSNNLLAVRLYSA